MKTQLYSFSPYLAGTVLRLGGYILRRTFISLLSVASLMLFFNQDCDASVITIGFSVTPNAGPLAGTSASGSFSYDSSSIKPGGLNDNPSLLTALDFTWNGIAYDASMANTGWMSFDNWGQIQNVTFGTRCNTLSCALSSHTNDWVFSGHAGYHDTFTYATPDSGLTTSTFPDTLFIKVPEPGTLMLLSLGLAGFGFARRRKTA